MADQQHRTSSDSLATIYDDLRGLARHFLSEQRPDHTLQPTALVHEAYLRMAEQTYLGDLRLPQVLCVAAKAMRHVLVDHARRRQATKRKKLGIRVPFEDVFALYEGRADDLLALHEALERLRGIEPRLEQVIELRFFGGLNEDQVAEALGFSGRTVRREWSIARRWLRAELQKGQ